MSGWSEVIFRGLMAKNVFFDFSLGFFLAKVASAFPTRKWVQSGQKVKKNTFSENSTHFQKKDVPMIFKVQKLNFLAQMQDWPHFQKCKKNRKPRFSTKYAKI